MDRIDQIFTLRRAKSGLFKNYSTGNVAYVGNGLSDNGVVGFVTPRAVDTVFESMAICVSAFCEATVQAPPFIACGRAGNGLTVLEPKARMGPTQLAYIAAYINTAIRWRFNWYRQTTADRLASLLIPGQMPSGVMLNVFDAMPQQGSAVVCGPPSVDLAAHALGSIYSFQSGAYHSLAALKPGSIPVVSCGVENNGISAYKDVSDHIQRDRLTIAFNGMNTLTAKWHPYMFAAKDDVAICLPKTPLRLTTELFIQTMVNRERWRYSYYRKCYVEKLARVEVLLPTVRSQLDEVAMAAFVENTMYWGFLAQRLGSTRKSG